MLPNTNAGHLPASIPSFIKPARSDRQEPIGHSKRPERAGDHCCDSLPLCVFDGGLFESPHLSPHGNLSALIKILGSPASSSVSKVSPPSLWKLTLFSVRLTHTRTGTTQASNNLSLRTLLSPLITSSSARSSSASTTSESTFTLGFLKHDSTRSSYEKQSAT